MHPKRERKAGRWGKSRALTVAEFQQRRKRRNAALCKRKEKRDREKRRALAELKSAKREELIRQFEKRESVRRRLEDKANARAAQEKQQHESVPASGSYIEGEDALGRRIIVQVTEIATQDGAEDEGKEEDKSDAKVACKVSYFHGHPRGRVYWNGDYIEFRDTIRVDKTELKFAMDLQSILDGNA